MTQYKYLVDIELRYCDEPQDGNDYANHVSETITVGIYDTYEEAVKKGNDMLETHLESRFPLNKHYNKKNRFGETYTRYLISELAYLTMPFSFYAHIKKLSFSPLNEALDEAINAQKRYKEWKI